MGGARCCAPGCIRRRRVAASALAGTLLVAVLALALVHPSLAAFKPQQAGEGASSLRTTGSASSNWVRLDRAGGRWAWDWSIEEEEAEESEVSYNGMGLEMPKAVEVSIPSNPAGIRRARQHMHPRIEWPPRAHTQKPEERRRGCGPSSPKEEGPFPPAVRGRGVRRWFPATWRQLTRSLAAPPHERTADALMA